MQPSITIMLISISGPRHRPNRRSSPMIASSAERYGTLSRERFSPMDPQETLAGQCRACGWIAPHSNQRAPATARATEYIQVSRLGHLEDFVLTRASTGRHRSCSWRMKAASWTGFIGRTYVPRSCNRCLRLGRARTAPRSSFPRSFVLQRADRFPSGAGWYGCQLLRSR